MSDPLLVKQPLTFQRSLNGVVVTWRNAGTTFIGDDEWAAVIAFCSPPERDSTPSLYPLAPSVYARILEAKDDAERKAITDEYIGVLDEFVQGHEARSRRLEEVRVSNLSPVNGREADSVDADGVPAKADGGEREEDTVAFDGPFHSPSTGGRPRSEQPEDEATYLHAGSVRGGEGQGLTGRDSAVDRIQAVPQVQRQVEPWTSYE